MAGPYLASVLPTELLEELDLTALELVEGTFIDPALSERQTDFVYKVDFSGRTAFLYVLLEHQRCVDPIMALRLYVYTARVLDRWLHDHPTERRVPPILPVVLYNGSEAWTAATSLHDLFELPTGLGQLRASLPNLTYRVDDLRRTTDEEIEARAIPPFGTVTLLLLRHGSEPAPNLIAFAHELAGRWLGRLESRDDLISAFSYILDVSQSDVGTVLEALRPNLDEMTQEAVVTAGEQLRQEGRCGLLLGLLANRFSLDAQQQAELKRKHLDAAAPEQLEAWAIRLFDAKSVEDVFTDEA